MWMMFTLLCRKAADKSRISLYPISLFSRLSVMSVFERARIEKQKHNRKRSLLYYFAMHQLHNEPIQYQPH